MRVIVDECLSESTKKILRKNKFIVLEIDEILKSSITDEEIYDYATENSTPLITHDRRFGEIYHNTKEKPPLTIILQVLSPHPEATNQLLHRSLMLRDLKEPRYQGKLVIITTKAIRIRPKD